MVLVRRPGLFDSGIDLDHPDLNVDATNSVSYISGTTADDDFGHGTYVAGILAARDNNIDVVGGAAGATVVAIKVCNSSDVCPEPELDAGIDYVSYHADPEDIVNISLWYPGGVDSTFDEHVRNLAYNGIRVVLIAGNAADDANNYSPGRVENINAYTVSAFKQGDIFSSSFSNYGNPPIDFSEPGEGIPSLRIGGGWGFGFGGISGSDDGTSYAAPHLAGLLLVKPNHILTTGHVSGDPDGDPDIIGAYSPFAPPPPGVVPVTVTGPAFIHKGSQGTYTATASGGTPPYSYFWNFVYMDCAPGSPDCSEEGVQQFGASGDTFNVPYTASYDKIKIIGYANDSSTPSIQGSGNKIVSFSDYAQSPTHN